MTGWEEARQEVLGRWSEVRHLIEARDDGSILPRADETRKEDHPEERGESFCRFFACFSQSGGCLGRLAALNHAVLIGDLREAALISDDCI